MALTYFPRDGGAAAQGELTPEAVLSALERAGVTLEHASAEVHGAVVRLAGRAASEGARELALLVAGNLQGVDTVDDDIDAAPLASSTTSEPQSGYEPAVLHTVKPGDSWAGLAALHWGDPSLADEARRANKGLPLDAGEQPRVGALVRIPRR